MNENKHISEHIIVKKQEVKKRARICGNLNRHVSFCIKAEGEDDFLIRDLRTIISHKGQTINRAMRGIIAEYVAKNKITQ
jgi:hypothetical protein